MNTLRPTGEVKTAQFEAQLPLTKFTPQYPVRSQDRVDEAAKVELKDKLAAEAAKGEEVKLKAIEAEAAAVAATEPKGIKAGLITMRQGFDRLFCPESVGSVVHAFPQIIGGGIQAVGSFVGGFFESGADFMHCMVEGIPVLENIAQPFADIFSGIGSGIESLFHGAGKALDSLGGALESLCEGDLGGFVEGVGQAASDAVGGVVDAVGDAVDAVGDAIGDLFSGW